MTSHTKRLSLAYRNLQEIHPKMIEKYGNIVQELDLSHNYFQDLSSVRGFVRLKTLVVDSNKLSSHAKIPPLPNLETLWVNRNSISNLSIFIDTLVDATPNLKYLSMLNNDACPNFFNGGSLKQYQDYRQYILSRMRSLTQLDSALVTEKEREDALRVYGSLPASVAFEEEERAREQELKARKEAERRERERQEAERRRSEAAIRRKQRKEAAKKKREKERIRAEKAKEAEAARMRQQKEGKARGTVLDESDSDDEAGPADITDSSVVDLLPDLDEFEGSTQLVDVPLPDPTTPIGFSYVSPQAMRRGGRAQDDTPAILRVDAAELTDSDDWSDEEEEHESLLNPQGKLFDDEEEDWDE